eukprot:5240249-Pleurochrysis_carterae.AAC.1
MLSAWTRRSIFFHARAHLVSARVPGEEVQGYLKDGAGNGCECREGETGKSYREGVGQAGGEATA